MKMLIGCIVGLITMYNLMRRTEEEETNDYCQAERIGTICYHESRENCGLCRSAHEEMKRLKREMGVPR